MLELSSEHQLFQETVRNFVNKELRPYALDWELQGYTPKEVWRRCGELGFLGLTYPEAYGGLGADFSYSAILHRELGRCGSPGVALGISVQTDMATPALVAHGNSFIKEKYLRKAIAGEWVAAIAVSEPDAGSDVAAIKTRARKDGDSWVISGTKTFITNGTQADFVTLLARTNPKPGYKGLSLFVVPTSSKGFSCGKPLKKTCYPASDTAELSFDDVVVSQAHLVGEEGMGFIYQMEQFQIERLAGCLIAQGGMRHCYELTLAYATERLAFAKPLIAMQSVRHKLVQCLCEIELVEHAANTCIVKANSGKDFTRDVSLLKLATAQAQQRVLEELVQIHGGWGLMQEYEVARYFRDSKLLGIGGGTNEIMKEIIAKQEFPC